MKLLLRKGYAVQPTAAIAADATEDWGCLISKSLPRSVALAKERGHRVFAVRMVLEVVEVKEPKAKP